MKCKLCGSEKVTTTYNGLIRNGGLGQYTDEAVEIYQCMDCDVIWHEPILDNKSYYESEEYRESLEHTSEEADFYALHDKESMDKFIYTGTAIFRGKTVADIGCGCGAFLDYVNGVAERVIAIEPTEKYRNIMDRKGFKTYDYAATALKEFKNSVDVAVSFDVIEHVENPVMFLKDIYELLNIGGKAIIGTPTDAPVMRQMLGAIYEKKLLFSTQHLWVFGEKNYKLMAQKAGFSQIDVKFFQRYGMDNFLGWIRDKEPKRTVEAEFLTDSLNAIWKAQLGERGLSDYMVLYISK